MADYNLDFDEGIIIETEGVHRSGNGGNSYIKKMLLTNKNIIYVTRQKTGGMFSKSVQCMSILGIMKFLGMYLILVMML